jgi:hypothetical protein
MMLLAVVVLLDSLLHHLIPSSIVQIGALALACIIGIVISA